MLRAVFVECFMCGIWLLCDVDCRGTFIVLCSCFEFVAVFMFLGSIARPSIFFGFARSDGKMSRVFLWFLLACCFIFVGAPRTHRDGRALFQNFGNSSVEESLAAAGC